MADKHGFLQLENGDINNLQGKAIIYSKYHNSEDPIENILSVYYSANPVEFAEKFGFPEEKLEEMLKDKDDEFEERFGKKSSIDIPLYAAQMDFSIEDIKIAQEDVLYAGEFGSKVKSQLAITGAVITYVVNYSKQRTQKSGLEDLDKENGTEIKIEKTYNDIENGQRTDYIQKNYISPLMHSMEDGNFDNAKNIARDFLRFCGKDGPLTDDAYCLASIIHTKKKSKTQLLYVYFEKMLAITSERYKDAAKLRDKIKQMRD